MSLHSPENFYGSPPAGHDGLFDWDFLVVAACFPRQIKPMDCDAMVEIGHRLLCWETKDPGAVISTAQLSVIIRHIKIGRGRVSYFIHQKHQADIKDPRFLHAVDTDTADVASIQVMEWMAINGTDEQVIRLCTTWANNADKGNSLHPNVIPTFGWTYKGIVEDPRKQWS
jgi:hypothetical protein